MYIDKTGKVKQDDPNNPVTDSKLTKFPITNPLLYFLRDLITESLEIKEELKIYIFQSTMNIGNFINVRSSNVTMNHALINTQLTNTESSTQDQKELFDKLSL